MSIFYLINGSAGHNAILDAVMRLLYIGTVPLLATMLVGWIIFAPQTLMPTRAPRRIQLASAAFFALFLGIVTMGAVHLVERFLLGGAPLSRRPFLTHFVTTLVMEPNNNSFPCFEVMFAAMLATVLWAARPRLGVLGWVAALGLAVARLYCGSNYPIDVGVGLLAGFALGALALSSCAVPLTFPLPRQRCLRWRPRHQAAVSLLVVLGTVYYSVAALGSQHGASSALASTRKSTFVSNASNDAQTPAREMLLLTNAVRQDGHLPDAENYLYRVLSRVKTGMPVRGVNVAEVRAGKTAYRCAAIRFEVIGEGKAARQRVTAVAARLARLAFHADGQLDHLDILGVRDQQNSLYGKGGTPVFTASLSRKTLILPSERSWLNAPDVNPGLWLRARSLLYFNENVLPAAETFPAAQFLQRGDAG